MVFEASKHMLYKSFNKNHIHNISDDPKYYKSEELSDNM